MVDTNPYTFHESVEISRSGTSHSAYDHAGVHIGQYYATDYASASSDRIDILSTRAGTVLFAGWDTSGYGNLVIIQYDNGEYGYYAHMRDNTLNVSVGEEIGQGHILGDMGNTGFSTGRHLHYERRIQRFGQTTSNTYIPNFVGFFEPGSTTEPEPEIPFAKHDFNGDGISDVVVHNNTTQAGEISIWFMNENGDLGSTKRTLPLGWSPDWKILSADVDVDGDKKGDIYLYNTVTNETTFWLDNDLAGLNSVRGVTMPDGHQYQFGIVADINGDSRDEIGWYRESDNRLVFHCYDENAQYTGYSAVDSPDSGYSLFEAGDFNNDGIEDLLMYNATTGGLYTDFYDSNGQVSSTLTHATVSPSSGWRPAAVIDANNDGHDDLFFMRDRGDITQWQGNEDGSLSSVSYTNLPFNLGWELGSSGDFNGDGFEELSFYRPSDGRHTILLNGADGQFAGDASFIANQVPDWDIIA